MSWWSQLQILGDNPASHNVGENFTDPGAIAVDDLGNSLTVNTTNNVNKNIVGAHNNIYNYRYLW